MDDVHETGPDILVEKKPENDATAEIMFWVIFKDFATVIGAMNPKTRKEICAKIRAEARKNDSNVQKNLEAIARTVRDWK